MAQFRPVICDGWHFTDKDLHDRFISLRGDIWAIKLSQNRHFSLKCLYKAVTYLRVGGIDFAYVYIFLLGTGTVPTM